MKSKKNLMYYMIGRFISFTGTGIQLIAIPLYILDTTHSAFMMGVFSALNFLPSVMTLPFAGILGDRKNRKKIMIVADCGRGALLLILGFLALNASLNIYTLFIFQIFISIMDSIFTASSTALLPELIKHENLMKGMSLRAGSDAMSMIIGPTLGGIIYGLFGIKTIFFINGLSFVVSAVSSMIIIYKKNVSYKGKMTIKSFFTENVEVLSFIKRNRGLCQLFVFFMILHLMLAPFFDIVLPYVVKKGMGFDSRQYGYLISLFTFGLLLGNIILVTYLKKLRARAIIKTALILETSMLFVLSFMAFPNIFRNLGGRSLILSPILIFVILLTGFFYSGIDTPLNTNLQKMVPNNIRSRFFAILGMATQGAIPLGAIVYGTLLDKFAYYYVVLVAIIIFCFATVIFMLSAVPQAYEPIEADGTNK